MDSMLGSLDDVNSAVLVIGCESDKILYASQRACEDFGRCEAEVIGKSCKDVFWSEFFDLYETLQRLCAYHAKSSAACFHPVRQLWEQVSAQHVKWSDSKPALFLRIECIECPTDAAEYDAVSVL